MIKLKVIQQAGLIDSVLRVMGSGFRPKSKVTFTVTSKDAFGQVWQSVSTFRANALGQVDLAKHAPISADYHRADSMGFIWSMKPDRHAESYSMYLPPNADSVDIRLVVKAGREDLSELFIKRGIRAPGVTISDVDGADLCGKLFVPENKGPHPAILLCSGSEGGIASQLPMASLLASHGYLVFVMAYFNYGALSKTLYEVPLTRFLSGVKYLRGLTEVDSAYIAAMAPSKGAEGLLAAASLMPDMKLRALIAISPSSVVWQGISKGKPKPKSSWSYQGNPLAYVRMSGLKIMPQFILSESLRQLGLSKLFSRFVRTTLSPAYSAVKKASKKVEAATIPVENIDAPLLFIAGGKDKIWHSDFMCQTMLNRRKTSRHADKDEVYIYPNAGHQFRIPNLPTTVPWLAPKAAKMILNFGGKPAANAEAQLDAWEKMLEFLDKHLRDA